MPNTSTVAIDPLNVNGHHNFFVGVTVADGVDRTRRFRVQRTGLALVRVQGPVEMNDPVGLSDGTDPTVNAALVKDGMPAVGVVKQAIANDDDDNPQIQLVQVELGAGAPSGGESRNITFVNKTGYQSMWGDYWWGTYGSGIFVPVAKQFQNRCSLTGQNNWYGQNQTFAYPHNVSGDVLLGIYRVNTGPNGPRREGYTPPYSVGEYIFCDQPTDGTAVFTDPANTKDPSGKAVAANTPIIWQETGNRSWTEFNDQTYGT